MPPGKSMPINLRFFTHVGIPLVEIGRLTEFQRSHRDAFAYRDVRDPLSHFRNGRRHFVPDRQGCGDPLIHVPMKDVEIRSTDSAIGDIQPYLTFSGRNEPTGTDAYGSVSFVNSRFHN